MGSKQFMKDKINTFQYLSILFLAIFAPFTGMGIYNLFKTSNIDSTISILIGFILSLPIVYIFTKINECIILLM